MNELEHKTNKASVNIFMPQNKNFHAIHEFENVQFYKSQRVQKYAVRVKY